MELGEYVACICEGAAEKAIIDILLDNDLLIFSREKMLEEKILRCREGKNLNKNICEKVLMERSLLYVY